MAHPKLSEDEIDDLLYFARTGEKEEFTQTVTSLSFREEVDAAAILGAAKDEAKSTPLHMAAGNGHLGTLFHPTFARESSSTLRLAKTLYFFQICPVAQARVLANQDFPEMVKLIVELLKTQAKDQRQLFLDDSNEHGNTGMHWAALGGHLETVKFLLECEASPALANERNYVPLDLASFNGHLEVVQYFLSFSGGLERENEEAGGLSNATASLGVQDSDKELNGSAEPQRDGEER